MSKDLLQQAYSAMRHDLRRTLLTMLGMAWGVATVVLLLAYGDGFALAIQAIFNSFGARSVAIYPGRTSQQAGGNRAGVQVRFTETDVELVRNVAPLIRHVSRALDKEVPVQYGPRIYTFEVWGIDPAFQEISNLELDEGRFVNDQDNVEHSHVVVIGSEAREKLFSGMPAVGESIRVNGIAFQVIGVMHPRMQEGDSNINRTLYIPFNSCAAGRILCRRNLARF
ncbi:MAG: ABC transporter permease [Terriglobales bacterium]